MSLFPEEDVLHGANGVWTIFDTNVGPIHWILEDSNELDHDKGEDLEEKQVEESREKTHKPNFLTSFIRLDNNRP